MDQTVTTVDAIVRAVRDALAHRDSRRDELGRRIAAIAEPAMRAARVKRLEISPTERLEYRTPVGDCSQWSNRMDYPDRSGDAYLALVVADRVRSLGPVPDVSFFDGHNRQDQQGPTRDLSTGARVRPAAVAELKSVARALPGVVADLLESTRLAAEREAVDADQALAELGIIKGN
jgi:hypothetical protein